MDVSVVFAGFAIGVCTFGAWLVIMLQCNRAHRVARVEASRERTRAYRRATLAARYTGEPIMAPVLVARVGSFCRVPGNFGYNKRGDALVCAETTSGRARWRKVTARAARSAA